MNNLMVIPEIDQGQKETKYTDVDPMKHSTLLKFILKLVFHQMFVLLHL